MMGVGEFLQLAVTGPSAAVYLALNIVALWAMRSARAPQTPVLTAVAAIGAAFGAYTAFIAGLAADGINPQVLQYNTIVGAPLGMAASLVVAGVISKIPEWTNLWPVSPEKEHAERIRDPMDPTQPGSPVPPKP